MFNALQIQKHWSSSPSRGCAPTSALRSMQSRTLVAEISQQVYCVRIIQLHKFSFLSLVHVARRCRCYCESIYCTANSDKVRSAGFPSPPCTRRAALMITLRDKSRDVHEHSCRNFLIKELSTPQCSELALWIGIHISKDRNLLSLLISCRERERKGVTTPPARMHARLQFPLGIKMKDTSGRATFSARKHCEVFVGFSVRSC